jgi:MSHA biogenesis protein MshP
MNRILRLSRQAGVGVVTAIFLLVVLAGLGVAMVGIYTSQQASSNLDVMGAQAYQAARAGLEWGIFQTRTGGKCAVTAASPNPFSYSTNFTMPKETSLSAFTVYVNCTAQGNPNSDQPLVRYIITAEACNMPDASATATSCPALNKPESVRRKLEAEL